MVITDESHPDTIGTAVLVHGGWGHPDDWTWVRRELEAADVQVITPDLPSHRSRVASFAADVDAVRDAIRVSQPPVVVAGCSYGGDVIGVAAVGEDSVIRLIYVASVPVLASSERTDTGWVDADPHLLVDEDGAFVLDNGWWFEAEAERLFDGEVLEHLRRTPRRWVSRASAADPRTEAAWQTIPTVVLVGRDDPLISGEERRWMEATLDDVRYLDDDHFIMFNEPDLVADVLLEALRTGQPGRS